MAASIRFISAGAGSGKTYRLTQILHEELVAGRIRPGGVLATTFTNKAAAELRERVRSHLVRQNAYALATAMGQARIGTVNSVCGALLQRFAFEAGMPVEQRVLDEAQAAQLLREAIDMVMERESLAELLKVAGRLSLDEPRRIGGEVPWRKVLRSLVDQARANGIDGATLRGFGTRNAQELLAHLPDATEEDLDGRLRAEIEAVLPAVREAVESKGQKNSTSYLQTLEACLQDLEHGKMTWAQWNGLTSKAPEAALKPAVQPVADTAARHAEHPGLHRDLRDYLVRLFDLAADALEAYDELKLQLGAIDFADQECKLLGILDIPFVAETLREELDLLMVDEFQDTSPIQLSLFLKLAALARQVVWVGDIKQAIYGFRGSDTALMKAVLAALPGMGGTKGILPISWRSRPSLVELVNEVFGERFDGLAPGDVVLTPTRAEPAGTPAVIDWVLKGNNKETIGEALASGVARLVNDGLLVVDRETGTSRPVRLSDIAILVRANEGVKEIAATLGRRGIASATAQPGLMAQPELVLVLACLRRLNDPHDTLATAEILSLADCTDPEQWLSDRLEWLARGAPQAQWKEEPAEGDAAHPVLATLKALRAQSLLLNPREAVELVLARCGIARRVVQWQQDADQARLRLANVDQLVTLAVEYEGQCHSSHEAATLSGFLLWLQELAAAKLDALALPGVDAVTVMTHHKAKGLEWPVVVLCDLAGDLKDRLWDTVEAESLSGLDVQRPLHDRFLRYWPWAFGKQSKVLLASGIEASPAGVAAREASVEEHKRLLYVSMTRARDVLVLARQEKKPVGEWMDTVELDRFLPATDDASVQLANGRAVPFRRERLEATSADMPAKCRSADLAWLVQPDGVGTRLPMSISPSALAGLSATVVETVQLGARIDTTEFKDRGALGDAIHACIAADLACPGKPLAVETVAEVLARRGLAAPALAAPLHGQLASIRLWLQDRWPGMQAIVEMPMTQGLENGQRVVGRSDLLIRTETGWVLLDHKSTPAASAQWEELASTYAGQLTAYKSVIEAASGLPVEETWLVLPVAGAALRVEVRTPNQS